LGADILTEVQRLPQWRDNLAATRESVPICAEVGVIATGKESATRRILFFSCQAD